MMKRLRALLPCLMALFIVSIFSACDNGGGSSTPNVGDNDINVVLCIGDSITDGGCAPAGAPYPSRLAGLSGKRVINAGACGEKSRHGAERISGLLSAHKPGYVCILEGANDAVAAFPTDNVIANLRSMIQACKDNKSIPIIGTLTPMYGGHAFGNDEATDYSVAIRDLAKEQHARLADLAKEFDSDESLIQDDGLHPTDAGNQIMAAAFNDKI
jgi:lysophospholipase L1-like esterase